MKRILSISLAVLVSAAAMAQTPRTAYHTDGFAYGHELNPALQPDTNYMSLPVLGNTSVTMNSTMKMSSLLFDMPGNADKLTLFTTNGTISKSDLLKKVGSGMNTGFDARLTLISIGQRLSPARYRTYEAAFRIQGSAYVPKALFSMLKDVENGTYNINGMTLNATSFLDLSYGESYRLDDRWTVGGKVKLLVGILNANAKVDNLNVSIDADQNWSAQGNVTANVSGLEYKTTTKEYTHRTNADGTPATYNMVDGVKVGGLGLNGLGLAIDAGAEYRLDRNWTFSAAIRDLGFITWFKSRKAENSGSKFEFEGFQNVSKEGDNTLKNQWNVLKDDLMDMIHVEEKGTGAYTKMLSATAEASARYKQDIYTAGFLYTASIQGKCSWMEARLNLGVTPYDGLDVVISPNYGTFGFGVGAMVSYRHNGYSYYLGSDRLYWQVNKQLIPTSLNAALQFGMTLPL